MKKIFIWEEETERSVSEIVAANGRMRPKEILHIARQLCLLLDSGEAAGQKGCIYPDNVMVGRGGAVLLEDNDLPLSAVERYLPPELDQTGPAEPEARIYAMGVLMLYMATGQEKKTEEETASISRTLLSLIERCTSFDPQARFRDIGELLAAIERETTEKKNKPRRLLAVTLVCLLIALSFFFWHEGQIRGEISGDAAGYGSGFSEGFKQGFADVPGIGIGEAFPEAGSGNLSGNFAAEGGAIAVSSEETVFFLFEGSICRMDPYTEEVETIAKASGAYGLQYYNDRIYYCTEDKVLQMDPETAKKEIVCDSRGGQFYIFDDNFYLYDSVGTGYLYRVDWDNGALIQLNGAMKYRCLNVVDQKLYYIAPDMGGYICRSNLDGGKAILVSSTACENFCVYGGAIYAAAGEGLVRMDLNRGNPEKLTSAPADSPNVSDGGIYYIAGSGRTLEWMSSDGRTLYTVVTTRTGSFNIAGQWIFYRNEEDGGRLWRVRVSGTDNVRVTR